MGGLYLFQWGSGVLGARDSPPNVQEVHVVSQLCAHVKHQLCCSHSLCQGLGLQPTAPEVEAEGTDPVSAGFDHPQSTGGGTGIVTHYGQLPTHHPKPDPRSPVEPFWPDPKLVPTRSNPCLHLTPKQSSWITELFQQGRAPQIPILWQEAHGCT